MPGAGTVVVQITTVICINITNWLDVLVVSAIGNPVLNCPFIVA